MDYPPPHPDDTNESTGLGLAARIAAQAATVQPNEAGTAACENGKAVVDALSPHQVIRGENHSNAPNFHIAFIDWLNFTFPFKLTGNSGLMDFDIALQKGFGFGIGANRHKGHLNYEQSWELGDGYGIFATGGKSVGGTSLVSLSGEGCSVVKDWLAVYDFLDDRKARITRIDLAHDDYLGRISLETARKWFEAGEFHAGRGHPPSGRFLDDFGSGKGKTLYVGQRKNGKLLRIYEKGKELGQVDSPWVRWELELHNKDRELPLRLLLTPSQYLSAAYPATAWINQRQSRIETATKSTLIGLDVLTEYCRKSYGKLIWTLWKIQGMPPLDIVETLAVEGIPTRINHAIPGEV
ncbi:replication initiation factor domain-containing protein [Dechloromonas sp. ARDL1]|uniref:replication initiation factor domain-containing protein n=1 Tax=Dechloromonas sp. ARDL1 TaxID=3322121 RepID=UPI003DA745D5